LTDEFQKFFELSFDMLAVLDQDGSFKNINQTFIKSLGWTIADLAEKSFWELVIPAELQQIELITQNLINGHPAIMLDGQVKCQNGRLLPVLWTAYPDLTDHRIYLVLREKFNLQSQQEIYWQALEASPTGILIVIDGIIRYCNRLAELIFGYTQDELIGRPVELLVQGSFRHTHEKLRTHYQNDPHMRLMGTDLELVGQHKDGHSLSLDIGLNPIHNSDRLVMVCSIIDNARGKESKTLLTEKIRNLEYEISVLGRLSLTDELTSVNNRRALFKQLELQHSLALRENQPISFVLIDVDNFKSYNDTYGHIQGDRLLRIIAEIMTTSVRRTEIVGRYGGEEFGMILPAADASEARILAERLRKMIEEYDWPARKITISAGAATLYPQQTAAGDPDAINNFVVMADRALYFSKSNGKNQVTHFNDLPSHDQENLSDWKIKHETPTDH
jgi:diguanylate cyclase (GGDEF)-like protein/PAS domain S-box-containing protein